MVPDSLSFDQSDQEIQSLLEAALSHYHDTPYLCASPLAGWQAARRHPIASSGAQGPGLALRALLDELIEALRPSEPCATDEALWRPYLLLDRLYRQRQAPQQVYQEALNLGKTHFYRERQRALQTLVESLRRWEQAGLARASWESHLPPATYTRLFGVEALIEQALGNLAESDQPRLLLLDGLGGLGKTALGRQVALQAMQKGLFQELAWLTAVRAIFTWNDIQDLDRPALTPAALLDQLAGALEAPECQSLPLPSQVKALCARLEAAPTLIVLDNLETAADVHAVLETLEQLARPATTRVLLTSRRRLENAAPIRAFHLQPLSRPAALAFMRHYAAERGEGELARAPESALDSIYTLSGGHPLAIKLVVGQASALPLEVVLNSLQAPDRLSESFYTFIYYHTWTLLSEPARQALLCLPHLAPQGAEWPELLAASGLSNDALCQAIEELVRFSLVSASGDGRKSYILHPLTRHFILSQLVGKWEQGNSHQL
ncbi:MAG: NB-ARC domain-containing protein [Chloroflexota bacterium]